LIELSDNAKRIFDNLYCLTGESIEDSFIRVAKEFSTTDDEYDTAMNLLLDGIWRPNTPVWLNAGSNHKIYSACFVVGLEDSMDGIYDVANTARKIFQHGSGVGIPIGNLRERNADIFEGSEIPEGKSSGPVTFMRLYDSVGESTKSGGRVRRAAILCTMPVWHPDIMEFIKCKEEDGRLANMNISVAITDKFMEALEDEVTYTLYSPRHGEERGKVEAKDVWDSLSYMAWKTADPGVLFIDTINRYNVLKSKYLIECPNPCVTGDTLVSTIDGEKRIDEMEGSEKVLTYNIEDDVIELEDVTFVGKTKYDVDVIELELEDGGIHYTLKCTPDHKIYTINRGYVEAENLTEDDDIVVNNI